MKEVIETIEEQALTIIAREDITNITQIYGKYFTETLVELSNELVYNKNFRF